LPKKNSILCTERKRHKKWAELVVKLNNVQGVTKIDEQWQVVYI